MRVSPKTEIASIYENIEEHFSQISEIRLQFKLVTIAKTENYKYLCREHTYIIQFLLPTKPH